MGIIAAGQITVVDLSDAPVLNTFITASRPTTQTYSKDSRTYKPSYASTPQVLTLKVTKAGSTANIIDSISSLHWFVVDGPIKTEITSKDNSANEYISGTHNEILTTKLDIDLNKGSKRYEVMGIWPDPSTGLDVQFGGYIDLLLTQNGATGPQGPQGDTGNGIANTVITYGLSMSDTTEPATWSSERPALVKGMYLWTRTVIIYTNGSSTTSYQISYIAKDADATAEIDKTKQELLEKLETVRDDSLAAVDEAKQQLVTVRDESLAAAEEAKQGLINVNTKVDNAKAEIDKAKQDLTNVASELNTAKQDLTDSVSAVNTKVDNAKAELTQAKQQLTTVSDDLSTAKQDFQNAVSAVDTKATNLQSDLTQAKQDLASQTQQLQEQAGAQSELTKRVSAVEKTADGTKTTVSELSKTVAQNGKDITSVTARTKVVEDDLAGTKTTLSQVQTTANSASQKTATLETGLNGLTAKFNSLSVGGANLLTNRPANWQNKYVVISGAATGSFNQQSSTTRISPKEFIKVEAGKEYTISLKELTDIDYSFKVTMSTVDAYGVANSMLNRDEWIYSDTYTFTAPENCKYVMVSVGCDSGVTPEDLNTKFNIKLERGNIATDYSPNDADLEQKVAEYKQNADQNYASLSSTVQTLDGQVQSNKATAEQTAQGFKTRIESLETYKDGESTRANAYFESAKTETAKQLTAERTAIANNYVAKSTYTSDVTGIRNELSATTTTANTIKTNLANYQASNDRAVANLQTNLQTANGNISSLKTKVEAVPGQITSAVSSVEGKIPKSVGGRNLALGTSADWSAGWTSFNGQENQAGIIYRIYNRSFKIGDKVNVRIVFKYSDIAATEGQRAGVLTQFRGNVTDWGRGQLDGGGWFWFDKSDGEIELKGTTVVDQYILKNEYWEWRLRVDYVKRGKIQWKEAKVEVGDLPTPWSPAPEDTAEQISNLSSEIKQTADGITLLATKTELNSAKNELQSGINTATNKANAAQNTANSAQNKANNNAQTISTHTTQISALNTGLQAKVSQTEFNTLSGRVTTAENNITAKANELSSKITSVEGKIPTNIGTVNLVKDTGSAFVMGYGITNTTWNETKKQAILDFSVPGVNLANSTEILPQGNKFSDFKPIKGTTYTQSIMIDTDATFNPNGQMKFSWFANGQHNHQKAYIKKVGEHSYQVWSTYTWNLENTTLRAFDLYNLHDVLLFRTTGTYLAFYKPKLTSGNLPSDWSPSPEDYDNAISQVKSEIKQTADGMTLLATKTELSTAKNELQSGITTATNKANAAQNTANSAQNKANSNAQTISTHTTQISALNTGLQAKVSQSEFNTLSGRVTTAENNITAKANELSSKITSVEGKIPTSVGGRNLWIQSKVTGGFVEETLPDNHITGQKKCYRIPNNAEIKFNIEPNFSSRLYRKVTFSAWVKYENVVQGENNWNKFNCFKHELFCKNSSTGATTNLSHLTLEGFAGTSDWKYITYTYDYSAIKSYDQLKTSIRFNLENVRSGTAWVTGVKIEIGSIPSDYSPAPEDTDTQISSLSSELKQTKDGITLLATKTELNTAKNELQSGINTATNKANSNAQTISTHTTQISALNTGLQAKVSQTEFNTLSGRVTNAENNITAKANELSSKITSVEGKIPTSIGGRNLWIQSKVSGGFVEETLPDNHITGQKKCYRISNNAEIKFNIEPNFSSRLYRKVTFSAWVKYENVVQGSNNWNVFNCFKHELYYKNSSTGATTNVNHLTLEGFAGTSGWKYITYTYDYSANKSYDQLKTSIRFNLENVRSGTAWVAGVKIEIGSISSDYSPAPEDTISQISSLSSELKQTKDGITLLATKTELNNAKTELQSGINTATNKANAAQNTANNNAQTINTHTTQISALNTGLQAKVSQTEFNTLSGRVTSAENNITAKANELSSKITSVEGKIPTNIGTVNLVKDTGSAFVMGYGITNTTWNETKKQSILDFSVPGVRRDITSEILPQGNKFCDFKPIKGTTYTQSMMIDTDATFYPNGQAQCTWFANGQHNGQKAYIKKVGAYSYQVWSTYTWDLENTALRAFDWWNLHAVLGFRNSGTYLAFYKPKLTTGNLPSDWSPAPEDTISQISSLSSELKQTKDGITLLATKTELNSAKNELQSGINTATNKANAAQNKANSNAQTISTHTNQISALNTGLSAKVSQSDFNTLSGRVTTAENNITAKANELSSKITKVEGKIPTSSGGRNLAQGTSKDWSKPFTGFSGNQNTCPSLYRVTTDGLVVGDTFKTRIVLKYTDIRPASGKTAEIWVQGAGNVTAWNSGAYPSGGGGRRSISGSGQIVFELTDKINADHLKNSYWDLSFRTDWIASGSLQWRLAKVERGMFFTDWSPAPEDTINQINSVSSELKQTTDAIKASVTSLDKSTVKSSSLTINSDGIVMKAGKSTTDVANAIGSYFAVNQNAINLFSDKIKVKGDMIVNGTITGDKIKASSVDVSKIVGIDANFIKSKIEHAMIDWLKGKTITAYNDNMTIDLQNGRISFKDGSNAVYRQTPDGIHTGFLHFDAGSLGGIYAAFGATSTREGINSRSSAFAGIRCYRVSKNGASHEAKIDKVEIVGDTVQFGHGYSSDGSIAMGGGFIIDTAAFANETPYSLNRVVKSIESLWRILHDHARNTGYRFNDQAFINALNNEYNAWHELHNM